MTEVDLKRFIRTAKRAAVHRPIGTVTDVVGLSVEVSGLRRGHWRRCCASNRKHRLI